MVESFRRQNTRVTFMKGRIRIKTGLHFFPTFLFVSLFLAFYFFKNFV